MKRKKIIIMFIIIFIDIFCIINKSYGKYVISDEVNIFHINNLMNDNIKPTINIIDTSSNNYTDEKCYKSQDVKIHYHDNTKVETAKYWYNETQENFSGEGDDLQNDSTFTKEGYYKIIVTDIFNNTNTIILLIDKTAPDVTVKYYKKGGVN